jgi:transglutaminase-like putative cysteine protease
MVAVRYNSREAYDMVKSIQKREGWATVGFLLGMIFASGWALVATRWTDGLETVVWAGLGGLFAGLLLGWSAFPAGIARMFASMYGLAWVSFLVGSTLPGDLIWRDRFILVVNRLYAWLIDVIGGGTGEDAIVFVLLLSALFWCIGFSATWNTFRRLRVWRAIVPPGIFVLIIIYYYVGPAQLVLYLVLYLFCAFLYLARCHIFEQERAWHRRHVRYDRDIRTDLLRAAGLMIVLVLGLSWFLPTAEAAPVFEKTWRRLDGPWRTVQEEWQRLFSTLEGGVVAGYVESIGSSLGLGGPRNLPDTLALDVAVSDEGRYYWRGAVYAQYEGVRWRAVEEEQLTIAPEHLRPDAPIPDMRRTLVQTVTNYVAGRRLLLAASQPMAVDREAEAHVNMVDEDLVEIVRLFSPESMAAGEVYVVTSLVPDVDVISLRAAGDEYPAWIQERYLQLPPSLPERVRLLAEEITLPETSNYDRAVALEAYLRQHIEYDLDAPELPEGRDYVDFLLFDSRRDSCSGYATAMVVMARSVGIPARLAVGYTQGELDAETGIYRVRRDNAHSWPEIYFPDYGWIEFEPTANQPSFVRPEDVQDTDAMDEEEFLRAERRALAEEDPRGGEAVPEGAWRRAGLRGSRLILWLRRWLWVAAALVGFAGLFAGGWWLLENWGLQGLTPIEKAYARLVRVAGWLGWPMRDSDTPFEWKSSLVALAPEAGEDAGSIIDIYVSTQFAQRAQYADAGEKALAAWRRVRPLLLISGARRFLHLAPASGVEQSLL